MKGTHTHTRTYPRWAVRWDEGHTHTHTHTRPPAPSKFTGGGDDWEKKNKHIETWSKEIHFDVKQGWKCFRTWSGRLGCPQPLSPFPTSASLHSPQGYPRHTGRTAGPAGDRSTQMPTLSLPQHCLQGRNHLLSTAFKPSRPDFFCVLPWTCFQQANPDPRHSHTLDFTPPCLAHAGSSSQKAPQAVFSFPSPHLSSASLICPSGSVYPPHLLCAPLPFTMFQSHAFQASPDSTCGESRRHFMLSGWDSFKSGSLSKNQEFLDFSVNKFTWEGVKNAGCRTIIPVSQVP